jgi:hypothetical protein
MSITSLRYTAPVLRGERPPHPDFELFDQAVALAEEGKTLQSVAKVFEHLFPTRDVPDLAAGPFSFIHGSSRVTVRLDNGDLMVTVPLVKLPTGGSGLAALRYVLTKMSGAHQLHQPRLRGHVLILEFRDKLARMHPAKLVEILRRMPMDADNNDDWLIGHFSALPLGRTPVEPLSDEEFARCAAIWREHWNDIDELIKESHRRRSIFFLNELTAFALARIRYALPLCGFLDAQLSESGGTFNNDDLDPLKRETTLTKCVKQMKAVTPEDLRRSLGHAEYAFTPLDEGTPGMIAHYFEPGDEKYMEAINGFRRSGETLNAALGLIGTYYHLLAYNYWPEEIEAEMKRGLELASGKTWREVANVLFDHARTLADRYGGPDEDDEDEDGEDEEDGYEDDENGEEDEDA